MVAETFPISLISFNLANESLVYKTLENISCLNITQELGHGKVFYKYQCSSMFLFCKFN